MEEKGRFPSRAPGGFNLYLSQEEIFLLHLHLDLPERAQLAAPWSDLSALYYINTFHCATLPVTHSCKHTAHERSFELLELVQQLEAGRDFLKAAARYSLDRRSPEVFLFAHVLAGKEQRV